MYLSLSWARAKTQVRTFCLRQTAHAQINSKIYIITTFFFLLDYASVQITSRESWNCDFLHDLLSIISSFTFYYDLCFRRNRQMSWTKSTLKHTLITSKIQSENSTFNNQVVSIDKFNFQFDMEFLPLEFWIPNSKFAISFDIWHGKSSMSFVKRFQFDYFQNFKVETLSKYTWIETWSPDHDRNVFKNIVEKSEFWFKIWKI